MNLQYNYITNIQYQGRNQAELLTEKEKNNYKSDAWLTFLQAKSRNLKILKGSKSVAIFKGYEQFTDVKEDKDGNIKYQTNSRPLGFARVFNLDQTEKYEK